MRCFRMAGSLPGSPEAVLLPLMPDAIHRLICVGRLPITPVNRPFSKT